MQYVLTAFTDQAGVYEKKEGKRFPLQKYGAKFDSSL